MSFQDTAKRAAGLAAVALSNLTGRRIPKHPGILVYHRTAPRDEQLPEPSINVTPERFRFQIQGMLDRGFNAVSFRDLLAARTEGKSLPPKSFAVTFDDIFESVYLHAWPVLRELQVPATMFLATAFLDSEEPFPSDAWGIKHKGQAAPESYRPVKAAQCREMAESGLIELGAHTHTHQDFRGRIGDFCQDLQESITLLRSEFGCDEVPFAFPYGRRHEGFSGGEMAEAARQSGAYCALTTECDPIDLTSDPFDWGRFNAYEWSTPATLAASLCGCYGWAPRLQERITSLIRRPSRDAGSDICETNHRNFSATQEGVTPIQ